MAVDGAEAERFGLDELAAWLETSPRAAPRKADQDRVDSAICLLVAIRWRLRPRTECAMVGDVDAGYMVAAASPAVRERLGDAAGRMAVAIDGAVPGRPKEKAERPVVVAGA
ncbi:hypothetical protein [Rhodoblastus sp.]|jgi:predicted RNase H-like nuclease|uniref:hypothetical protein n=1 Tax=Rhodoblastus sp. TaxID=1962975 RepID=UPI0025D26378|nr:hypothetical protein [Rhodoblastus sp.]